jgi:periplasmic divalent cation tolerance protein
MYVSVYVTASSEHEAKSIVKNLLGQRLIACANLFPITSLYFWDEKLQEEAEIAIIMKTRAGLVEKLIDELKKIHSYDVPCIVSWDIIKGSKDYLAWIKNETIEPEADNLPDSKSKDS